MPAGCGDDEGISGGLTGRRIRGGRAIDFLLPFRFTAGVRRSGRGSEAYATTRPLVVRCNRVFGYCKPDSGSARAGDWFRTSIQNIDVAPVDEESVPLLSGSLADDSEFLHVLDRFGNGGRRNR